MATAYLGLGGNVGDLQSNLWQAIKMLDSCRDISVTAVSRFYKTKPVGGPENQPDFVNAVVAVDCRMEPRELLDKCLSIEQAMGRVRIQRWGPRTVDIDLLLFNHREIDEVGLVIPHPMLRKRLFVLAPLSDVAPPDLTVPPDNRVLTKIFEDAYGSAEFESQKPLVLISDQVLTELAVKSALEEKDLPG